jgi:hypothetical protein
MSRILIGKIQAKNLTKKHFHTKNVEYKSGKIILSSSDENFPPNHKSYFTPI